MPDDLRSQAAAYVDREFRRAHADLFREQRRQERRELAYHKGQLQSFARNREDAEARHAARIRSLDEQEKRAAALLERQQRSLKGRLQALTKAGRATQRERREAIAEDFERSRMREHRSLEGLKERQFQAEMADRIARARQMKFFRLDNHELRQHHLKQHQATREQKIESRVQAVRHTAEQSLKQELQRLQGNQQEQTSTRAAG